VTLEERPGRVVVLNGASSCGKTTVARATCDRIGRQCVVLRLDDVFRALHPDRGNDWAAFLAMSRALFASGAAFAASGLDVIVDTVFERPACYEACTGVLGRFQPLFVRVDCPIALLEERERLRGNRPPGLARDQAERVHHGCAYDLTVDTSVLSAEACAVAISNALSRAFREAPESAE